MMKAYINHLILLAKPYIDYTLDAITFGGVTTIVLFLPTKFEHLDVLQSLFKFFVFFYRTEPAFVYIELNKVPVATKKPILGLVLLLSHLWKYNP